MFNCHWILIQYSRINLGAMNSNRIAKSEFRVSRESNLQALKMIDYHYEFATKHLYLFRE